MRSAESEEQEARPDDVRGASKVVYYTTELTLSRLAPLPDYLFNLYAMTLFPKNVGITNKFCSGKYSKSAVFNPSDWISRISTTSPSGETLYT